MPGDSKIRGPLKFSDRNILFKRGQAVSRNLFRVTRPAGFSPPPLERVTLSVVTFSLRLECITRARATWYVYVAESRDFFRRGSELSRCPASCRRAFFNPVAEETRKRSSRPGTLAGGREIKERGEENENRGRRHGEVKDCETRSSQTSTTLQSSERKEDLVSRSDVTDT